MKAGQSGVATVAFVALIMSAIGLLALGLVKAQWLGERASLAQKTYSERFVSEETTLTAAHVLLNDQDQRKQLLQVDSNALVCPNELEAQQNRVGLTWPQCNAQDPSIVALQVGSILNQASRQLSLMISDPLLRMIPAAPIVSFGAIVADDNAVLNNPHGDIVAQSAGTATLDKGAKLLCAGLVCRALEHDPKLVASGDVFATFFDADTREELKKYASLAEPETKKGGFHWIEGDLSLNDEQYGSPQLPVLLVVEGNLTLGRRTAINGIVLVLGSSPVKVAGASINGMLAAQGNVHVTDLAAVNFSEAIVKAVRNTVGPYEVVQGSWRDF